MSRVCFVVLHYGDMDVTRECIDSISALETDEAAPVVIVDNDERTPMNAWEPLKNTADEFYPIHVVKMEKNGGFSHANNKGYQYAVDNFHPDYIVVTNNDVVFPQKDFLSKIKDCHKKTGCAVLSPDIVGRENGEHQSPIDTKGRSVEQLNYTIRMNSLFLKLFPLAYPFLRVNEHRQERLRREQNSEAAASPQKNIVPCGACIIFTKDYIEKESLPFYPETEFYYEEYILHYNCTEKGYLILYNPELQVIHGDGIATKKRAGKKTARMKFVMRHVLESAKVYKRLIES